jgi:hypothetical protein
MQRCCSLKKELQRWFWHKRADTMADTLNVFTFTPFLECDVACLPFCCMNVSQVQAAITTTWALGLVWVGPTLGCPICLFS